VCGQFVDVLGVTIVIVALPAIGRDPGLAEQDLQWVASIYALCFGGMLLLAGRAADLYGRRRLFATGLALFTVASLACGLAGVPALLVGARALQGLGEAVAVPAALSLLTTTFPDGPERARALGVWTAAAAGGGVTGFFLGGVLTGTLGWHWVFWVNVPVGALGLALAPLLLAEHRDQAAARRLEVAGAVTGTAGLLLLVCGFTRAEQAGFASAATLGTLALAAALLAGFWLVEGRVTDPLVPHRHRRGAAAVQPGRHRRVVHRRLAHRQAPGPGHHGPGAGDGHHRHGAAVPAPDPRPRWPAVAGDGPDHRRVGADLRVGGLHRRRHPSGGRRCAGAGLWAVEQRRPARHRPGHRRAGHRGRRPGPPPWPVRATPPPLSWLTGSGSPSWSPPALPCWAGSSPCS
jgi:hypothetical protein